MATFRAVCLLAVLGLVSAASLDMKPSATMNETLLSTTTVTPVQAMPVVAAARPVLQVNITLLRIIFQTSIHSHFSL